LASRDKLMVKLNFIRSKRFKLIHHSRNKKGKCQNRFHPDGTCKQKWITVGITCVQHRV
jgi:hypothetical protein